MAQTESVSFIRPPRAMVLRWPSPWVVFYATLTVLALFALYLVSPHLYVGADGAFFINTIETRLDWDAPGILATFNPLVGAGSLHFPLNPWLNPVYLPFLLDDERVSIAASYVIAVCIYWLGIVILLRALGVRMGPAAFAALVAIAFIFPPLMRSFTLTGMQANPGIVVQVAAYLIAMAWVVKLPRLPRRQQLLAVVGLAALLFYGLVCDPFWMTVLLMSALPFGLAALICGGGWRGLVVRLATGAVIVAAFWLLGVVDYLRGMLELPARQFFADEIFVGYRTFPFGSFALASKEGYFLGLATLAGLLLALILGTGKLRLFAVAAVLHFAAIIVLTLYYVGYSGNWPLPRPTYLERVGMPVYFSIATVGWVLFGQWLVRKIPALGGAVGAGTLAVAGSRLPIAVTLGVASIGFAAWASTSPLVPAPGARPPNPILDRLVEDAGLEPGASFRGRVIIRGQNTRPDFIDQANAYVRDHLAVLARFDTAKLVSVAHIDLWNAHVPTLYQYGQMISPEVYFLATRLFAPPDFVSTVNSFPIHLIDETSLALAGALGVRYIVDPGLQEAADGAPSGVASYTLSELRPSNLGQYSPTEVIVEAEANRYPEIMGSAGFDFERQVIVTQPLDEPLVPATGGAMTFVGDGFWVTASSPGRSMLLLPLQYSHCFDVSGGTDVELVRANLVQTGLLFSGALDVRLRYIYGPLSNSGCRLADLRELRDDLNLRSDETRSFPDLTKDLPWSKYPLLTILYGRWGQLNRGTP